MDLLRPLLLLIDLLGGLLAGRVGPRGKGTGRGRQGGAGDGDRAIAHAGVTTGPRTYQSGTSLAAGQHGGRQTHGPQAHPDVRGDLIEAGDPVLRRAEGEGEGEDGGRGKTHGCGEGLGARATPGNGHGILRGTGPAGCGDGQAGLHIADAVDARAPVTGQATA